MSGATTRHRAVTLGVLAAVLVGTAASTSGAPAARPDPVVRDLDLAASANPSAAEPVVADDAFASDAVSRRRAVKSDVTATGSAICDGCDAASTALQVLYVSRVQEARLDNTAAAWTQGCADCTATALSVQVVVLRGAPAIVPNNRALAVNAACTSCGVAGVAFQLVVSSRRPTLPRVVGWAAGMGGQAVRSAADADDDPGHARARQTARPDEGRTACPESCRLRAGGSRGPGHRRSGRHDRLLRRRARRLTGPAHGPAGTQRMSRLTSGGKFALGRRLVPRTVWSRARRHHRPPNQLARGPGDSRPARSHRRAPAPDRGAASRPSDHDAYVVELSS